MYGILGTHGILVVLRNDHFDLLDNRKGVPITHIVFELIHDSLGHDSLGSERVNESIV